MTTGDEHLQLLQWGTDACCAECEQTWHERLIFDGPAELRAAPPYALMAHTFRVCGAGDWPFLEDTGWPKDPPAATRESDVDDRLDMLIEYLHYGELVAVDVFTPPQHDDDGPMAAHDRLWAVLREDVFDEVFGDYTIVAGLSATLWREQRLLGARRCGPQGEFHDYVGDAHGRGWQPAFALLNGWIATSAGEVWRLEDHSQRGGRGRALLERALAELAWRGVHAARG